MTDEPVETEPTSPATTHPASSAHIRVELPAIYREMFFIRQGVRDGNSAQEYSLPRFIVELRTLARDVLQQINRP